MVSNDNCRYGGHSRGSGKVLREREAEGGTVLVLSDFLLVSVRSLQSPRWLPMGVPQFTVSPHLPSEGLCHKTGLPAAAQAEATTGLGCSRPRCQHTRHTLSRVSNWHGAGGPWVVSTQPPSLTQAWAWRRCLGYWGHPGRQALGHLSFTQFRESSFKERHVATAGTLMGLARWMAALQEEKRGVCTGTDGALAVSLLPTAADSWPSWWLGPERESPGPRNPDVGRPGGKAAGVGGSGHQRSSGKQTYGHIPW